MKKPTTTATILNILGLAVAIAAFLIVAMVRYYDLRYDKSYPDAERIYNVGLVSTQHFTNGDSYTASIQVGRDELRLLTGIDKADNLIATPQSFPFEEIEDVCVLRGYGWGTKFVAALGHPALDTLLMTQITQPAYFRFFGIKIKEGSLDRFTDENTVVISDWLAKQLFPRQQAVGQKMVMLQNEKDVNAHHPKEEPDTLTVIAVFKDLPHNTSLSEYPIVRCYPKDSKLATHVYVKLKSPDLHDTLERKMYGQYMAAYHDFWDNNDTAGDNVLSRAEYQEKYEKAPHQIDSVELVSMHDQYYSPNNFWDLDEHQVIVVSKSLVVFGIVLLLLAFLNYSNFAAATVPLYRRKTAIRKVEGCSDAQLRWEMFGRFLLGAVIAFAIALLIVEACARTKAIPFVSISLKLTDNLPVVWITSAISLLVAVIASLYPVFYSAADANLDAALKKGLSDPTKGSWWRKLLLRLQTTPSSVVQFYASFAVTLFLLLVLVQNQSMKTADLGFDTQNVFVSQLYSSTPTSETVSGGEALLMGKLSNSTLRDLESVLRATDGIVDATWALDPVLGLGDCWGQWHIRVDGELVSLPFRTVSAHFFDFFRIPLVKGKSFDEVCKGDHEGRIVNEAALRLVEKLKVDSVREKAFIDGVIRDFHNMSLVDDISPCIYVARNYEDDMPSDDQYIYIKTERADSESITGTLRAAVQKAGLEWEQFSSFKSLDEVIREEYQKEDDFATLMALFVGVTLFVTLTGLLGMVMLDCHYRRRELSLRRVYGASNENLLWMVVRNILIICVFCFACAAPLAVSLFRKWQQHFAYKSDIPVWPFLAAFFGITLLAIAITVWQALRTLREEPTEVIQ